MGRIDAVIPDDLEKKLRLRAIERFGGKKGSLTDALEELLEHGLDPKTTELIDKHKSKGDEKS